MFQLGNSCNVPTGTIGNLFLLVSKGETPQRGGYDEAEGTYGCFGNDRRFRTGVRALTYFF